MKKILLLVALILLPLAVSAVNLIDGIYYNLNSDTKTAEVVKYISKKYSGDFVIPSSVTVEGINYKVTSIAASAFAGCSDLTSITIPNSVTTIGKKAFSGCTALTSVTVPDGVTSIGDMAFYYCTSLTSLTIGKNVETIYHETFGFCNLKKVDINSSAIVSKDYQLTSLNYYFGYQVEEYIIGESIKSIGNYAFFMNEQLTSISIPNSVTSIGDFAFRACSALTSITIPNSVTSMGEGVFFLCENLSSINLSTSLTTIEKEAFFKCKGLTSIDIPNSVTEIRESAFAECEKLSSITIPDGASIGLKAFDDTAWYTSQPNGVVYLGNHLYTYKDRYNMPENTSIDIKEGTCSIAEYAFQYCHNIVSITIPNSMKRIGMCAFDGCKSLTSITLPNSISSIGSFAFFDCYALISIAIPNNVTTIEGLFPLCTSLTSVIIGNGVTSIHDEAFMKCQSLKDLYCYAEQVPETNNPLVFDRSNYRNATLHVPAGSMEAYRNAEQWKDFGSIVALSDEDPKPTMDINTPAVTQMPAIVECYSIDGKHISSPQRGLNIIRMSDGTTKKVVIK